MSISTVIACSGQANIDVQEAAIQRWGARQYANPWDAPFLPEIGRPPEWWCVDFARWSILKASGHDWLGSLGVATVTWELWPLYDAHLPVIAPTQARAGDQVMVEKDGSSYHYFNARGPAVGGFLPTSEGDTSSDRFPGSDYSGGVFATKARRLDDYTGRYNLRIWRPPYASGGPVRACVSPFTASQVARLAHLLGVAGDRRTVNKALQTHCNRYHGGHLADDGDAGPATVNVLQRICNYYDARPRLALDSSFGPATSAALTRQLTKGI